MTSRDMLSAIAMARVILDERYIKWCSDNGHGGHCHMGCLNLVFGALVENTESTSFFMDSVAREMHQDLFGAEKPRLYGGLDKFDVWPCVFINNHLGKEAILEVYDEAMLRLELEILCEEVARTVDVKQEEARTVDVQGTSNSDFKEARTIDVKGTSNSNIEVLA